jgi:hypothetical protein
VREVRALGETVGTPMCDAMLRAKIAVAEERIRGGPEMPPPLPPLPPPFSPRFRPLQLAAAFVLGWMLHSRQKHDDRET